MARDLSGSSSNYLDVGDVSAIDITGTALTVCCWFQPDSLGDRMIIAKDNGGAGGVQYRIWHNGGLGTLQFDIGDAADVDVCAGGTPSTGVWNHVAMTKNGTSATALTGFLNGTVIGPSVSTRTIQNTTATLRFGGRSSDTFGPLDARMADVAIWNAALSPAEVGALAKGVSPLLIRPANLKGYWPLWGASSPEADLSGNGNAATITGTVNAADHGPVGIYAPTLLGVELPTVVSTVARSAALNAVGAITAAGARVGATIERAAAFAATATVTVAGQVYVPPRGVSIGIGQSTLTAFPDWTQIA